MKSNLCDTTSTESALGHNSTDRSVERSTMKVAVNSKVFLIEQIELICQVAVELLAAETSDADSITIPVVDLRATEPGMDARAANAATMLLNKCAQFEVYLSGGSVPVSGDLRHDIRLLLEVCRDLVRELNARLPKTSDDRD
jgi:hypothetical protein